MAAAEAAATKVAVLEAELRTARSFADPELFNKLQIAQQQRAALAQENRELQAQVAGLENTVAAIKRAAADRVAHANESTQRQLREKQDALDEETRRVVDLRVQCLELSRTARVDKVEALRLGEQVRQLKSALEQKQQQAQQLQRLLAEVLNPTGRLVQSLKRKQEQLCDRLEEVGR